MNAYTALFICAVAALLAQALQRAYFHLPKKELKRRASREEPVYRKIQDFTKYGVTARAFLSLIGFVFAASSVIIASRTFDPLVALLALAVFFALLKIVSSKNPNFMTSLAAAIAPYLVKPLYYIEPFARAVKHKIPGRLKRSQTTKIYETEDLQDLIKLQQKVSNNRIPENELTAALNALEFGGKRVKDHMVPRGKIHFVTPKDPIGPILLSELHKSGFTCFPVLGNSENELVGMIYLDEVAEHTGGGMVGEAMNPKVAYVREDKPLEEVLQAFSKTGRNDFVVVDEQARITGLINLKEVLEQMIGHSVKSDFDDYDNPSAVAEN